MLYYFQKQNLENILATQNSDIDLIPMNGVLNSCGKNLVLFICSYHYSDFFII